MAMGGGGVVSVPHSLWHVGLWVAQEAKRQLLCMPDAAQVIDLGDSMGFALLPEGAGKDQLTCSDPTIPSDDSNLVIKVREAAPYTLEGRNSSRAVRV